MTAKTNATRKPPMRAYPNLPKEDLDALVAYMLAQKKYVAADGVCASTCHPRRGTRSA